MHRKVIALLCVSALMLSLLTACSTTADSASVQASSEIDLSSIPLTEEERLNSTYNPIYMGAEVDRNGNPLVVGTDEEGQVANQEMIDHHAQFEPQMYKITDRVYMTNSYGLANSVMIEGDNGIIIVDTNDSIEAAQMELEQFRTVTDKPVSAVIYTHFHYVYGTQAYIPEGNPENIPIIAHEDHAACMNSVMSEYSTTYVDRLMRHHGGYLPFEGEDGVVGCALGPFYSNPWVESATSGYIAPNTLIPRDGTTEMTIEGVKFQFTPQASDSEDSMTIYLPEEDVCINNLSWPTFANLYTLRGEPYRDPRVWIEGIDSIIEMQPEHLLTCHGLPLSGEDTIKEELTLYRDGIQYVFDQTVRYMNKGYSPDQIVETVEVPEYFTSGTLTKEMYGEMEYYIRGIYGGLIGWFGTDTIELHPVTPEFEAQQIVEGFGGKEVVIAKSRAALEDKQYSWAAQLITYVLTIDPENAEAKQIKADALRSMAQVAPATTTRHFYLCQALELEGKLDKSAAAGAMSKDKLMAASPDTILRILRASIAPEKCGEMEKTVGFTFTDVDKSYGFVVRHGVGQIIDDPSETAVEIQLPYETLVDIIVKNKDFQECLASGEIVINGDPAQLQEFMGIFDIAI